MFMLFPLAPSIDLIRYVELYSYLYSADCISFLSLRSEDFFWEIQLFLFFKTFK